MQTFPDNVLFPCLLNHSFQYMLGYAFAQNFKLLFQAFFSVIFLFFYSSFINKEYYSLSATAHVYTQPFPHFVGCTTLGPYAGRLCWSITANPHLYVIFSWSWKNIFQGFPFFFHPVSMDFMQEFSLKVLHKRELLRLSQRERLHWDP